MMDLIAPPPLSKQAYRGQEVTFGGPKVEAEFREKIGRAQLQRRLEVESVRHGLRKCALIFNVPPERLEEITANYAKQGLILGAAGSFSAEPGFAHKAKPAGGGRQALRCVIAKTQAEIESFKEAATALDDRAVGAFLGYPACCCDFFARVWKNGCVDPVWETGSNTTGDMVILREDQKLRSDVATKLVVLRADEDFFVLSSALRYIGLRINSHFACTANCQASLAVAKERIELARQIKLQGLDDLLGLLRLPYEWACHRGRASVMTPCFKISSRSVGYEIRRVLRQEGWF